jgi:hypothetical protein
MRINDMIEDYPESRIDQKFFDNLTDHVKHTLFIIPGATRVDPKDPTRRKNYAATKDDLVYLITSDWAKHEIESVYDDHIQKLTLTVAGGAATPDTVKHTTKRHIGSVGQSRITITPRSTGQHDTTDHNTELAHITKRLQDLTEADHTLNTFSPEQTNVETDVSRANTEVNISPPPAPITPEPQVPDQLNLRPPSSKDFFKHPSLFGTTCIITSF